MKSRRSWQFRWQLRWQLRHSIFNVRDIEDSMVCFRGVDGIRVEKWVTEFEQTATIFKFNELQKVLYAKRLLTGAAKMSLRTS
jgi:hypothetical protein